MIKRLLLTVCSSLALYGCQFSPPNSDDQQALSLPPGMTLVAQQQTVPSEVGLTYTKVRLENGLTVVLHQDDSDPLVHVDVTYHVGSAREELGRSGFAHFFEHMMFQGSKHVADDEHLRLITEAGGNMNGTTSSDRTNYYQTVPANQLEKVLWLEADRMGFLLDAVSQEKFEIQRDTVKNERAQVMDNQPYGLRSERTGEALYPVGHPYSWSTIGYVEDLDRVNVNDLKRFFLRWYGPNNAVLTIGGDIDIDQTLSWVHRYFSSIKRGPDVEDAPKVPVTLDQDRYVTVEDQVYLPLLQLTFPTVHARHEDEAPLDVLSDILGGGKTSLFYKNLVRENHAVQAVVGHPCRELACEFQLIALANPASSSELAALQQRIEQTLAEFEQRGVNQDDLDRTKAGIEAGTIFGLQSVAGKVTNMASNQLYDDEPDLIQYDLDRYNSVTKQDVMRVYEKYIKGKAKVVLSIVPKGQVALAAAPANFVLPEREFSDITPAEDFVVPQVADNFDRSQMPAAGPSPVVKTPSFWQQTFDNKIEVIGHTSLETPTVSIVLSMEGGPLLDPVDKAGLSALTADLMGESTKNMSNTEMANQLALLGSSISFSSGGRFTQVRISSLSKHLDKTLALFQEKLFQPAFREEDFNNIKQRLLQSLQQSGKNPSVLASRAVNQLMYGEDTRISLPDNGTVETLTNITLQDVKGFYDKYYSPQHANMVVVSNLDQDQVVEKLEFLSKWKGPDYAIPQIGPLPEFGQPAIYLVDKPDAAQSSVRIFRAAPPYDATGEHFKNKLMNFPFGGMFNSRINLNLREDKGYTYGVSSDFIGGKSLGRFMIAADLNQVDTVQGLQELFMELATYQDQGMSEEELLSMRSAYSQADALRYETPYSKSGFLRNLVTYELPVDYRDEQKRIIDQISREELNGLAGKYLDLDSMQIVVVGDAAQISEGLKQLGRPVIPMQITM